MKRSEFIVLRKKVFGAMKNCRENLADKCADCAYDNDDCLFRLQEDQVKLLYALDQENRRLRLMLFLERGGKNADGAEKQQR